jgi:enamine deaminase RidA (YjgF/YER057c/UK114 family)
MAIKRISPGPRLSQAVSFGDTVYVAGQVASDTSEDARGQTRQILAQIDALLAQGGSDKNRILWANVWLADMADYAAMNEAWEAWVPKGQAPARATVEARLAAPQYKVEIMCVAARRGARSRSGSAVRAAAKRPAARAKAPARKKRRR